MKNRIVRILINYCAKRAANYEQRVNMLLNQKGLKYIYAIGCSVYERDVWLKRILKLQKIINKS